MDALHARVRDISYTPGTDAPRQISPLLLTVQDLTGTTLVRLGALDDSVYADIPGSRASLECLSSVVGASSLAGNDLASVLYANPYEGATLSGYPVDDESVHTARHAEATPRMTGHLPDAAHQLKLSGTRCHRVDTGITDTTVRQGNAHANASGNRLLGEAFLHRSRAPWNEAPIDHVTAAERLALQSRTDNADALENGAVGSCSPWACRGDADALGQDNFGLAT